MKSHALWRMKNCCTHKLLLLTFVLFEMRFHHPAAILALLHLYLSESRTRPGITGEKFEIRDEIKRQYIGNRNGRDRKRIRALVYRNPNNKRTFLERPGLSVHLSRVATFRKQNRIGRYVVQLECKRAGISTGPNFLFTRVLRFFKRRWHWKRNYSRPETNTFVSKSLLIH